MPRVIANKITGETMPDTAENRIKTFRHECDGIYRAYSEKYETVTYGIGHGLSNIGLIEKYGLVSEHKRLVKEGEEREKQRQEEKEARLIEGINAMPEKEAKDAILTILKALDSYSLPEALSTIEQYKDDARWCDSYR